MNTLLSPFGKIYGRVMTARNAMYAGGGLRSYDLGARTISVGNITTGGTGKTPLVGLAARMLLENGERVCILTRGYGRKNPKQRVVVSDGEKVLAAADVGGDEPVELALRLGGKAVVIADRDRVSAAKFAIERFGVTTFILDDGFQHRKAKRDLDIVCIDATEPFGGGEMLPAGRLREPLEGLARADAFVITRRDLVSDHDAVELVRMLRSYSREEAPIFDLSMKISRITPLDDLLAGRTPKDNSDGDRAGSPYVFCGLGNPDSFVRMLSAAGIEPAAQRSFPDHRRYEQVDVSLIEQLARDAGAEVLLTTAKDAVKLNELEFTMPVLVVEAEPEICDIEGFRRLVTSS